LDIHPEIGAVADALANHLTQIPNAEHHVSEPPRCEQPELVYNERLAGYLDQSFRGRCRDGPKTRRQAPGKNRYRHQFASVRHVRLC
jgi:hypothetical protein